MERKVKYKLPSKYRVGLQVKIPLVTESLKTKIEKVVDAVIASLGYGVERVDLWESDGTVCVTTPLIYSIAETKAEVMSKMFEQAGVPISVFLYRDGQKGKSIPGEERR